MLTTTTGFYFKKTSKIVREKEILNRSHKVKVISGDMYINHLNGLFFTIDGKYKITLNELYPVIVKAYDTHGRLFAARKNIHQPLIAGSLRRKHAH